MHHRITSRLADVVDDAHKTIIVDNIIFSSRSHYTVCVDVCACVRVFVGDGQSDLWHERNFNFEHPPANGTKAQNGLRDHRISLIHFSSSFIFFYLPDNCRLIWISIAFFLFVRSFARSLSDSSLSFSGISFAFFNFFFASLLEIQPFARLVCFHVNVGIVSLIPTRLNCRAFFSSTNQH